MAENSVLRLLRKAFLGFAEFLGLRFGVPGQVPDTGADIDIALRRLVLVALVGVFAVFTFALKSGGWKLMEAAMFFGVGLMAAGASLLSGVLLGFLFGIPYSQPQAAPQTGNSSTSSSTSAYRANTNLEQISDWLTKIIVGVGLTQLSRVPEKLKLVAGYLAVGLGDYDGLRAFSMALLAYFSIDGFLIGFLWARLYLPRAFRYADLTDIAKQVDKLQKQPEIDAEALALVGRQLNPSPGAPEVTQEELTEKIKAASTTVKIQIFYQAQDLRSRNWRDVASKPRMERTIPIFRALIESDIKGQFHKNYGQLGFALKDKLVPDWKGAEAALTRGIEIRGQWQENGWLYYELNRAVCRIQLDPEFQTSQPSKQDAKKRIADDLHAAYQADLEAIMDNEPTIQKWMSLNNVTYAMLK